MKVNYCVKRLKSGKSNKSNNSGVQFKMSDRLKVNRNYQDIFVAFLEQIGLSSFGCYVQTGEGFMNEVFSVHPHKETHPCSCQGNQIDKKCLKHKPNFHYIPEDIKIWWNKYPLREAVSNQVLTDAKMEEILRVCLESIEK